MSVTKIIKDSPRKLSELRSYRVVKANDLIRNSRFHLSTQEQKIILYLISKIKPEDMELKEHTFELVDFISICGLCKDSGANYQYIKQTLKGLRDKSVWIELEKGVETTLGWIDKIKFNSRSGKITIKIDDMMKPYLLQLQDHFTQYELLYTLAMKSQYSLRLYELMKSYEFRHGHTFDIDELKKALNAEKYARFPDFKRSVLDMAINEIEELSDISVSYSIEKQGRRYARIVFSVKQKKAIDERLKTWENIQKIIDRPAKQENEDNYKCEQLSLS